MAGKGKIPQKLMKDRSVGRPERIDLPQFDSNLRSSEAFKNSARESAIFLERLLSKIKRSANIIVAGATSSLVTGDDQGHLIVPVALNKRRLVRAFPIILGTAGTTGNTEIQIRNKRSGLDLLTTKMIIASTETIGVVGIVDRSQSRVETNDILAVDIDLVSSTAPQGLAIVLEFK